MSDVAISIVTGTYNRLTSLRAMVDSVRLSVGDFHHYEIVVVDGGSTDGTLSWCRDQADIVLIEQGELLGAVRAFNAGAEAANGAFVILANDDITFVAESILYAYSFMCDNPRVGIGCFKQDRNDRDWHVEHMKAIAPDGRHVSVPYGQVCIVPTWLGDLVGWWGDYLHTYGGDNELSCNVIEQGYAVVELECSCIHDGKLEDALRAINHGNILQSGIHPDTFAWSTKWPNGPTIVTYPITDYIPALGAYGDRVMYMPLFEKGHALQYRTKVGLRQALEKEYNVVQYDMHASWPLMYDYALAFAPHIFVFQLQDSRTFPLARLKELRSTHPSATFVNWNGDYHPENLFDPVYMDILQEFDVAGFVTTEPFDLYHGVGINAVYWQIGFEEAMVDVPEIQAHDVVFLGNGYSAARRRLSTFLTTLPYDVGIYGSWDNIPTSGSNLYDFSVGAAIYNSAKIAISTQQYPDGYGFVSNRLFQALAAGGCLVLQQRFDGMEELLGLQDGVHLVVWSTFEELGELLSIYLQDDNTRQRIAETGTAYCLEHHSFDARVQELKEFI